jgi:N-acetylglucosaminyl-diphospho-decaprenol L-rhamnosyltransferase
VLTLAVTYAGLLGGAERTMLDFVRGLPGGVALACPEGRLAERARDDGLAVMPISDRRLEVRDAPPRAAAELTGHARDVRKLARTLRPDLLLAWGMRSAMVTPLAVVGLSPRPALLMRHVDFLPGPLIARGVRVAARRFDRVSANSDAVARELDPHGRLGARLSVICPGVDLSSYQPDWDVAPDPEVLVLGALVPWKRPDLALDAVARAARELPEIRLTLAGAPMGAEGQRLAGALRRRAAGPDLDGRVRFAGETSDPREVLRRAWCLLHCAEREPFGNVIVEALASGRPVVAPAAGGPAEILDETCGRLYPPGDSEAAARALVELMSSPERARSLGAAGRVRAGSFDAEEARRRFAEVAAQTVAARRAQPGPTRGERPAGTGLALVTVPHNSRCEVERLLRSIQRHLPGASVIVVDSGSQDGSADAVRAAAPEATVVELGENVGFGRASNVGVARVQEPVCVLVNPDVELIDDSLASLAEELCGNGRERILAPRVLSRDGSPQDTAHLDPGAPLMILRTLVPPAALPGPLRRLVDPWRSGGARTAGWAAGCCLVARTTTLRRLGPFDERIFLFGEDLELGLRAAEQGVETWFRPDARVLHLDAHSTARAFGGEPFDLLARQRRAVIGERRGPAAARRDHWTWLVTYADRILLKAITRRSTARERRQLEAQWRARRAPARLGALSEAP